MNKLHLLQAGAIGLLAIGCSHLPFVGNDSDEAQDAAPGEGIYAADWQGANPPADSSPYAYGFEAAQNGDSTEGAGFEPASTDGDANPAPTNFTDGAKTAELTAQFESLQASFAALSGEVRTLTKQVGALNQANAAGGTLAAETGAAVANLAGRIEELNARFDTLPSQIAAVAAGVGETGDALREVRNEVRNVGSTVGANIAPAIERGTQSAGNWFKVTLGAVLAGFACVGFFLWKNSGNQRNVVRSTAEVL